MEILPLNTINGKTDNESAIPVDIKNSNNYLPNCILKSKYIQEILNELDGNMFSRIIKLRLYSHIDKLIDKKCN